MSVPQISSFARSCDCVASAAATMAQVELYNELPNDLPSVRAHARRMQVQEATDPSVDHKTKVSGCGSSGPV